MSTVIKSAGAIIAMGILLLPFAATGNLNSESEAEVLDAIFKLHRGGKTVLGSSLYGEK